MKMNNMTQEEKANRYDKAVINGSRLWECGEITRENYEYIFPELKESEDERIRKNIISWLKNIEGQTIPINDYNSAIAWLEKQGEQKASYTTIVETGNGGINALVTRELPIEGEQKPAAWSEEDEEMMSSTVFYLNEFKEGYQEGAQKCISWLKSLKDRVQPQPKQEWSEEDKNRINRLIAYFEDKESFTAEDDIVYANWLKFLKDRYTWKPSDAQIKVCKEVYADILSAKGFDLGTVNSELNRLEEQLKKPSEE